MFYDQKTKSLEEPAVHVIRVILPAVTDRRDNSDNKIEKLLTTPRQAGYVRAHNYPAFMLLALKVKCAISETLVSPNGIAKIMTQPSARSLSQTHTTV